MEIRIKEGSIATIDNKEKELVYGKGFGYYSITTNVEDSGTVVFKITAKDEDLYEFLQDMACKIQELGTIAWLKKELKKKLAELKEAKETIHELGRRNAKLLGQRIIVSTHNKKEEE